MGVTLHPVDSSMMSHDEATPTLMILFHSGERYGYSGVERQVFEALLNAPSQRSYLRDLFDDTYPYPKIRGRGR